MHPLWTRDLHSLIKDTHARARTASAMLVLSADMKPTCHGGIRRCLLKQFGEHGL